MGDAICSWLPKSLVSKPGSSLRTLAVSSLLSTGPVKKLLVNTAGLVEEHNVLFSTTHSLMNVPFSAVSPSASCCLGRPPAPPGSGSHKLCVNTCSARTQRRILFLGRYGGGWRGRRVDPVMWKLESYSRDKLVGEGAAWRSRR